MTPDFSISNQAYSTTTALYHFLSFVLFSSLILSLKDYFDNFFSEIKSNPTKGTFVLVFISLVSFLIYFVSSENNPTQYFMAITLSMICAAAMLHPTIALSQLVLFLILRPWELITDNSTMLSMPRLLLIIFFISYLMFSLSENRWRFKKDKIQLAFFALSVWIFLTTLTGGNMAEAQEVYFESYFKTIIIAFLMFQTMWTKKDYTTVVRAITLAVFGLAVFALIKTVFVTSSARLEGAGAIQNSNDLAAVLIFVLPLSLISVFQKKFHLIETFFSLLVVAALSLGLWKAQSRAAYLSIFIMAVVFWITKRGMTKKLFIQAALAVIAALIVLSQLSLGRHQEDLQESQTNRIGYWKAGVAMAIRNPVLGVGFSQYPKKFNQYGVQGFTEGGDRTAHSSWILLLAECGFPALILILFIFYRATMRAWKLRLEAPELILCLAGYTVCFSFLSHIYTSYPYILLALIFSHPLKAENASV